jgi:hypothetical protein
MLSSHYNRLWHGRAFAVVVLIALIALLDASPASACSCAGPSEPAVAAEGADVVFEGSPTAQELVQADLGFDGYFGAKRFRFDVARYFKGQLGPSVSLFTVDQSSACGREYSVDESHVIYARYSDSGLLTDFACSRSRPSSFADEDLAFLGAGVEPDPSFPEAVGESEAPASSSEVSSGIHRVPIAADGASAGGCASSLASPRPARPRPLASLLLVVVWLGWLRRRQRLAQALG